MIDKFSQPTEVDDITIAFPARIRHLMPDEAEIPEEFQRGRNWGNRLFNDWFLSGIKSLDGLKPRDGIDKTKALRHIKSVMGSFEPKHQHKESAVAYLFDKWFEPTSTWEQADSEK